MNHNPPHIQLHPRFQLTARYNYRIEGFGLEKTFKDHLVQTPSHGEGHLPLDQVAQSAIQPDLEHFQRWGIH